MRVLLQRVKRAKVEIAEKSVGKIGHGLLILLGVKEGDTVDDADYLLEKCVSLRIFSDDAGKLNLSVQDVKGEVLVVSQFTLYAETRKGRRPGFSQSANLILATNLYEYFLVKIREVMGKVESGKFGADMQIELVNDGPVTILIDSVEKTGKRT